MIDPEVARAAWGRDAARLADLWELSASEIEATAPCVAGAYRRAAAQLREHLGKTMVAAGSLQVLVNRVAEASRCAIQEAIAEHRAMRGGAS